MSEKRFWTGHEAEMRAHEAAEREPVLDLSGLEGYTGSELDRYAQMTDDQVRDHIRRFDAMFGQERDVEEVLARIRRAIDRSPARELKKGGSHSWRAWVDSRTIPLSWDDAKAHRGDEFYRIVHEGTAYVLMCGARAGERDGYEQIPGLMFGRFVPGSTPFVLFPEADLRSSQLIQAAATWRGMVSKMDWTTADSELTIKAAWFDAE